MNSEMKPTELENLLADHSLGTIVEAARAIVQRAESLADDDSSEEPADTLEPTDYTDVGQAGVFAREYGDRVRYSRATDFIVYDGAVWRESGIRAQGLAQALTERQLEEARGRVRAAQEANNAAAESEDAEQIQAAKAAVKREEKFRDFVLSRRKSDRIRATLTEARPALEIDVAELDKDGHLLNTPGGTVDLRTGVVFPHRPDNFCTKITGVSPSTEGAELWQDFLQRLTCGDRDLQRYLQECAGMFCVGQVLKECLVIAYGTGGNGKSTFYGVQARVLGDYSGALSSDVLTAGCRRNVQPELAELRGKRFVVAAELEQGQRLDTSMVKRLCSTDTVTAERKYRDPFLFRPTHSAVLFTNHLPKISADDAGTWARLVVVPFAASFRGEKGEIKNYTEYLYQRCGGAVLQWMIDGARAFLSNGGEIEPPECVRAAIEAYKTESDWLTEFLTAECELGRYQQPSGELYACYRDFCDRSGEYQRSGKTFKEALAAKGFEAKKIRSGIVIVGLRIIPAAVEADEIELL